MGIFTLWLFEGILENDHLIDDKHYDLPNFEKMMFA